MYTGNLLHNYSASSYKWPIENCNRNFTSQEILESGVLAFYYKVPCQQLVSPTPNKRDRPTVRRVTKRKMQIFTKIQALDQERYNEGNMICKRTQTYSKNQPGLSLQLLISILSFKLPQQLPHSPLSLLPGSIIPENWKPCFHLHNAVVKQLICIENK